jgi:hypothetical protein
MQYEELNRMTTHRRLWLGLGFLALFGLSGSHAQAGTLTVVLTWGPSPSDTLTIVGGGGFATDSVTNGIESLTFNTQVLNQHLASNGSNLTFAAGSGVSDNQPSATQSSGATLTSTGQLNLTGTSAGGANSMTIQAFLTDYSTPTGTSGMISSSASATFTNSAIGDTQTFNSWYNNDNSPGGMLLPSGLVTYTSTNTTTNNGQPSIPISGTTTAAISPFVTPFSLTNTITVSLTPTGKSGQSDQYSGTTLVTASGTVIPEPASIIMMLTGMPVPMIVLGMLRRRKAAVKA